MPKKRKTRKEKEKVVYHLESALLGQVKKREQRVKEEFAYLEAKYIKKDLLKTFWYSVLVFGLILAAKKYLG